MRGRTCAGLTAAAVAAVLAVDATAAGAVSLRGKTSQGLLAGVRIGQGGTYSYRSPADRVHFRGDRRVVGVSVKNWSLSFAAPRGRRLTPGHFLRARSLRSTAGGRVSTSPATAAAAMR